IVPDLKRRLSALAPSFEEGRGVGGAGGPAFLRLFPPSASSPSSSPSPGETGAEARWGETYASLARAARPQGEGGEGLAGDGRLLGEALDRSRAATGALEVAQAGNELSGLGVKQALALAGLLAAQHRAETMKSARELVDEAEARQRFKSFLG